MQFCEFLSDEPRCTVRICYEVAFHGLRWSGVWVLVQSMVAQVGGCTSLHFPFFPCFFIIAIEPLDMYSSAIVVGFFPLCFLVEHIRIFGANISFCITLMQQSASLLIPCSSVYILKVYAGGILGGCLLEDVSYMFAWFLQHLLVRGFQLVKVGGVSVGSHHSSFLPKLAMGSGRDCSSSESIGCVYTCGPCLRLFAVCGLLV